MFRWKLSTSIELNLAIYVNTEEDYCAGWDGGCEGYIASCPFVRTVKLLPCLSETLSTSGLFSGELGNCTQVTDCSFGNI